MLVAFQPSAAQLHVRPNGQRSAAATVRLADPAGRGRAPLYVLIEPVERSADSRLVQDLIVTVEREFARGGSRSTTSSLTGALQAASAALHHENKRSMPREQLRLSGLCATIRGDTLYAAQAGGAGAWLCRAGRTRPIRAGDGPMRPKLGAVAWLEPELVSVRLQPGDRILLASTSLLVTGSRLSTALADRDAEAGVASVADLHARSGARSDLALVLLHFDGDAGAPQRAAAPEPAAARGARRASAPLPSRSGRVPAREARRFVDDEFDEEPAPSRRRGAPQGGLGLTQRVGAFMALAAARLGKEIWTAFGAPPPRDPPRPAEPPAEAGLEDLDDDPWAEPPRTPPARPVRPRARAARTPEPYSPAIEDDEADEFDRPARQAGSLGWLRAVIGVGVLALVLGSGGYMALNMLRERQAAEELSQRVAEAETKEQAAQSATDPAIKRQLLEDARRLAEGTPKSGKEAVRVNGVINRVVDQLDQLDGVVRLVGAIEPLGPDALGKGNSIAQFAVGDRAGGDKYLFALDAGGSAVQGYQIGPSSTDARPLQRTPLFARGDRVGDVTLTELKSITWVPLGGPRIFNALLCLDADGHLVEYDPDAGRTSVSKLGTNWERIQGTGAWNGNFYVLDTPRRQLLRYQPAGTGYNPQPTSYFDREAGLDYTQLADMAVDGDLFLLFNDGHVQRYQNGKAAPFAGLVPGTPIQQASRIATSAATKSVYIADTGNRRIVQFSKSGEYQRQFSYNGPQSIFNRADALQVDEGRGKLYLLTAGRLYVVDLPKT